MTSELLGLGQFRFRCTITLLAFQKNPRGVFRKKIIITSVRRMNSLRDHIGYLLEENDSKD